MSWDDEQERELSLANLDSTVRTVAALWSKFDPRERGNLTRKNRDLSDALYTLCEHIAGQKFERPVVQPEPEGYPAKKRIADLERFLAERNVRENALHHARKAWLPEPGPAGVDDYAEDVTTLAQAFERYLTDGTVYEEPINTEMSDDDA